MILREVDLEGSGADLRIRRGRVTAIAAHLEPAPGEEILEARGGALLPGLHDHHLHALALASSLRSVRCGPEDVPGIEALTARLRSAQPDQGGWIRAVAYHESVAGPLDRTALDQIRSDVPIRLQHRSGSLWIVNSAAIARLRATDSPPEGAERDPHGGLTGRLFRADGWLRDRMAGSAAPDLREVGELLAAAGVTGFTDATPTNGRVEVGWISSAQASGELPQHVRWMGGSSLPPAADGEAPRHWKLVVDERTLPTPEILAERFARAHRHGRPVAVHCVTRAELIVTCAALEQAGAWAADRIEHASVAPPEGVDWLQRLGVTVVTQPNFVRERGDAYLADVDPVDRPWLYRCAGLESGGVLLGAGTDAPYGAPDPWLAMAAAVDRRTRAGALLGADENLSPERALALFTTPPERPGGPPRSIAIGAVADLCLLRVPWRVAREELAAANVRATLCAGRVVHDSEWAPQGGRE